MLSPLRIAMLAPPWIPIPAPGYGGIETVVDQLTRRLVGDGHDVELFAAPGTRSTARVHALLRDAHPDDIGLAEFEADHVARAFAAIDRAGAEGRPFDVIHDHCGFTALAMADRIATPVVHTLHGAFDPDTSRFYERHGAKAALVAISRSQRACTPPGVSVAAVIPNPITIAEWPLKRAKDGPLLWLGRMHVTKGPHRAIDVALAAGRRLVLAGPVQLGQERFFAEHVEPRVDGDRIVYAGEIGGVHKQQVLADAQALLMPISWEEPFGMVMIEALACGTPVIAFPRGAATEIVVDGVNGFLVEDTAEMAAAVERLGEIDPRDCRASVAGRYDIGHVADAYARLYRAVARPVAGRAADCPAPGTEREGPPPQPPSRATRSATLLRP